MISIRANISKHINNKKTTGNIKESKYSLWFLMPAAVLYMTFFIVPNIMGFVLGFTDWSIHNIKNIKFVGIYNFLQMFKTSYLKTALFNTLYFTIVTSIVRNILGFVIALLANRELMIKNYLRTVVFAPCVVSSLITGIVFGAIYSPENGMLNSFLRTVGLGFMAQEWLVDIKYAMLAICGMEIWHWTGFSMVIYLAGLQSIPKELYEASIIDGAGYFQQLRNVTIPLIMPSITVNILLSMISGLKVFAQVYALTNGGPADMTQVISTLIYKAFSDGLLGYSAAMGMLFTIIVFTFSFLLLKVLRKMEVEM